MHKRHSQVNSVSRNTSQLNSYKRLISVWPIRIFFSIKHTFYAVDKSMNILPLQCTMGTKDSSNTAFLLYQFPQLVLQPFEPIYFHPSILLEYHSRIFQVSGFSSISTTKRMNRKCYCIILTKVRKTLKDHILQ